MWLVSSEGLPFYRRKWAYAAMLIAPWAIAVPAYFGITHINEGYQRNSGLVEALNILALNGTEGDWEQRSSSTAEIKIDGGMTVIDVRDTITSHSRGCSFAFGSKSRAPYLETSDRHRDIAQISFVIAEGDANDSLNSRVEALVVVWKE